MAGHLATSNIYPTLLDSKGGVCMSNIGEPQREIVVEPLELPIPAREPVDVPATPDTAPTQAPSTPTPTPTPTPVHIPVGV